MALTRHATGNSRPRVFPVVEPTAPATKRKTTTKRKPVVGKTAGGRVTKTTTTKKPAVAGTHHKRKPTVGDKVKGAVKKAAGALERKPGKKAAGTAEMRGHDGKKKTVVKK